MRPTSSPARAELVKRTASGTFDSRSWRRRANGCRVRFLAVEGEQVECVILERRSLHADFLKGGEPVAALLVQGHDDIAGFGAGSFAGYLRG
jgi:hypothetical protein